MLNERLRRVTDLFIEGTELFFGMDENQKPILCWLGKLNSFEVEEARRDASVKRGLRIAELSKEDSPEYQALMASVTTWDDAKLAESVVEQDVDEIYLGVFNDIEADPDWREKVDMVRRGSVLLDDEGAPEDDPRRADLAQTQSEYIAEIRKRQSVAQLERLADVKGMGRQNNIDDLIEKWRNRASLEVFVQERRVSELYAAMRDCAGTIRVDHGDNRFEFDHSECDHSKKLLGARGDVYQLPEAIIERAVDALDNITVPAREAGNSDAPESSSASPEQPSVPEESTPSIPVETPPGAVMT